MEINIPTIGIFQRLHDLRLQFGICEKIVGAPHGGGFLADLVIALPVHPNICAHVIGALIYAGHPVFGAAQRCRHRYGVADSHPQIRSVNTTSLGCWQVRPCSR